jgi:hypothetical protein
MKARFILSTCIMLIYNAIPQAQSIFGLVTDAVTKKAVSGAMIAIVELSKTVSTDSGGNYSCDLPKPGAYSVKVEAPNYLKYMKKVIISSSKEVGVSKLELNVLLYNISTNADSAGGIMAVKYSFPSHASVDIAILDSKGNTVRKAFDRSRAGGMHTFSWDGKDNDGKPLPAGHYTCRVVSGRLVMIRALTWKGAAEQSAK